MNIYSTWRIFLFQKICVRFLRYSTCFVFLASPWTINLPVKRKKGESQNGCFKKTRHAKFSEKWTFRTLWYAHLHFHRLFLAVVRFSTSLLLECFTLSQITKLYLTGCLKMWGRSFKEILLIINTWKWD